MLRLWMRIAFLPGGHRRSTARSHRRPAQWSARRSSQHRSNPRRQACSGTAHRAPDVDFGVDAGEALAASRCAHA